MISIWKKVGDKDGGFDTIPEASVNFVTKLDSAIDWQFNIIIAGTLLNPSFTTIANIVAPRIPKSIDPRTRRTWRTAVSISPKKKIMRSIDPKLGFNLTRVPGFNTPPWIEAEVTINPAFCSPINAINRPIPTAMAFFILGLMAFKIISLTPTRESRRNRTPEINTTPNPTCQEFVNPAAVAAGIAVKTKTKFSPIPGACAMGYLAYRPIIAVARAAEMHVAVITEPKSIPVSIPNILPDNTMGCTTTI
jgi:hypothetical protein